MPENEDLKWGTHNGIRKTLFFAIFRDIKYVEFKRLKSKDEFFELGKIEQWEEGWLDKFLERYVTKEVYAGKLLQTQKWLMSRSNQQDGVYRVKIYHMDNDEFRAKVYPQSPVDAVRMMWFNRKHFRIL